MKFIVGDRVKWHRDLSNIASGMISRILTDSSFVIWDDIGHIDKIGSRYENSKLFLIDPVPYHDFFDKIKERMG